LHSLCTPTSPGCDAAQPAPPCAARGRAPLLDEAKARRERERVQRERVDTWALLNLGSDHERPVPDLVGLSPHLLLPEGAAQRRMGSDLCVLAMTCVC